MGKIAVSPWVVIALMCIAIVVSVIGLIMYGTKEEHIKEAQIAIKIWLWQIIVIAMLMLLLMGLEMFNFLF